MALRFSSEGGRGVRCFGRFGSVMSELRPLDLRLCEDASAEKERRRMTEVQMTRSSGFVLALRLSLFIRSSWSKVRACSWGATVDPGNHDWLWRLPEIPIQFEDRACGGPEFDGDEKGV
jgi:hypothetical protein